MSSAGIETVDGVWRALQEWRENARQKACRTEIGTTTHARSMADHSDEGDVSEIMTV